MAFLAMNDPMNEIIPGLYLGDIFAARTPEILNGSEITHILTVARGSLGLLNDTLETKNYRNEPFQHLQIELDDLPDSKLLEELHHGVEFIDRALNPKEGLEDGKPNAILVHCLQGMSRSCSFVVAYLVWKNNISVGQALEMVQEKRKKARPNAGFYKQLLEWQRQCKDGGA
ncbi:hypothetical protein ABW19_dt0203364 [Dactylella cylindrospora]|nr:hypothetical protein ABW19_dt0203364 [Dactylella cylindrospora]